MLSVFELNVKNSAFAQQTNNSNAKGFLFEELVCGASYRC